MKQPLSLKINFSWTLIGNIIYHVFQWAILVVLARLTMPEIVGRFALGLAISAPIILLTNMQLRNIQATDAKNEYKFIEYLSLRIITSGCALIIIYMICIIIYFPIETQYMIMIVSIAKVVESFTDIAYGYFQKMERFDMMAKSFIFRGGISFCSITIILYFTNNILWGLIGFIISSLIVLLLYDYYNVKLLGGFKLNGIPNLLMIIEFYSKSKSKMLKLFYDMIPLGFTSFLVSLIPNIPRYFVKYYFDEKLLGIFAAIAYFMIGGTTIVGALGQTSLPVLANYWVKGEITKFRRLMFKMLGFGLILALVGITIAITFGKELLELFYGAEYAEYNNTFIYLMIASGISYLTSFIVCGLISVRIIKIQVPIFMISTVLLIALCFVLIPIYGINGVAFGLIIIFIFQFLSTSILLSKNIQKEEMERCSLMVVE